MLLLEDLEVPDEGTDEGPVGQFHDRHGYTGQLPRDLLANAYAILDVRGDMHHVDVVGHRLADPDRLDYGPGHGGRGYDDSLRAMRRPEHHLPAHLELPRLPLVGVSSDRLITLSPMSRLMCRLCRDS